MVCCAHVGNCAKGAAILGTTAITPRYLTYRQAEAYCSVSRWTLYRAVKNNDLKAHHAGTAIRFDRRELDRWMQGENA